MDAKKMLENLGESLGAAATVKSVFGDPILIEGKTVVPVAKVALGFGSGFGTGRMRHSLADSPAEGGGGGGGMRALPAGALEITASSTRFVPFRDFRWVAAAFVGGIVFGALLSHRRLKSQDRE